VRNANMSNKISREKWIFKFKRKAPREAAHESAHQCVLKPLEKTW